MIRSGFKRPALQRVRTVHTPVPEHMRRGSMAPVTGNPVSAIPKENVVEHEGYRRLVAAMPCSYCQIEGYSQAAHPNTRKAKGMKADDRLCFPLCCDRPGVEGCHPQFDQYRLVPREVCELHEIGWAHDTQTTIVAAGLWPKNLPRWSEE